MTSQSDRSPSAAIVEAALSVVSPGKIGMTASNQTNRKTQDVGHLLRHLGEPLRNVPLVQELPRDDHEQQDPEPTEDQSDEVPLPEGFLLLRDCHGLSPVSSLVGAFHRLEESLRAGWPVLLILAV